MGGEVRQPVRRRGGAREARGSSTRRLIYDDPPVNPNANPRDDVGPGGGDADVGMEPRDENQMEEDDAGRWTEQLSRIHRRSIVPHCCRSRSDICIKRYTVLTLFWRVRCVGEEWPRMMKMGGG